MFRNLHSRICYSCCSSCSLRERERNFNSHMFLRAPSANTPEVKIERAKYEPPINIEGLITSDPIRLTDISPGQSEKELEKLFEVRKQLGQIGQPVPLSQLKNLQAFQQRMSAVSRSNLMGSTIPTTLIVVIAATGIGVLFCCLRRNTRVLDFMKFHREIRHCCSAHRAEDLVGTKPPHLRYCTDVPGYQSALNMQGPIQPARRTFDSSLDSSFNPTFNSTFAEASAEASMEVLRGQKRTYSAQRMRNLTSSSAPPVIPEQGEESPVTYSSLANQARNTTA